MRVSVSLLDKPRFLANVLFEQGLMAHGIFSATVLHLTVTASASRACSESVDNTSVIDMRY